MNRKLPRHIAADERGLTTIEFVLLAIVAGIVAAIVVPSLRSYQDRQNDNIAKSRLEAIASAANSYFGKHETYVGMTPDGLKGSFDPELELKSYRMLSAGPTSYCVQTSASGRTWHVTGRSKKPARGACPSL